MNKIKFSMVFILSAVIISGFSFFGCSSDSSHGGDPSQYAGKLLILQAYGNGTMSDESPAGVSHSFVELYNTTDQAINLNGINLYYANGIRGLDVTEDEGWKKIPLDGKSIPAGSSFLILGAKHADVTSTRHVIEDNYGDINDSNLILSRRSFKIALIEGNAELTVQNPFNIDGNFTKIAGYIDMVGAANNPTASNPDNIFGFEVYPARNSASSAVRRISLDDKDDNSSDFEEMRYASDGITNQLLYLRKPRNSIDTASGWDPFESPAAPVPVSLMIFQVYGAGFGAELGSNDNTNTGSISHNFIQLYNNSGNSIDLSSYSVQWANGKANGGGTVIEADQDWNVINLSGSIPAYGSYLIRGREINGLNGRLQITSYDIHNDNFYMSNRSYKVALVSNQTKLSLSQPWDNDSIPPCPIIPQLVDLVGARNGNNDSVEGFKGVMFASFSKQNSIRRKSLDDTGNNLADFRVHDYRTSGLTNDQVELLKPRTATETSSGYSPAFIE